MSITRKDIEMDKNFPVLEFSDWQNMWHSSEKHNVDLQIIECSNFKTKTCVWRFTITDTVNTQWLPKAMIIASCRNRLFEARDIYKTRFIDNKWFEPKLFYLSLPTTTRKSQMKWIEFVSSRASRPQSSNWILLKCTTVFFPKLYSFCTKLKPN